MKHFHSLNRLINEWLKKLQRPPACACSKETHPLRVTRSPAIAEKQATRQERHSPSRLRKAHPPVMFLLAVISLTSIVGYRSYNQPQLAVGKVSPVKIEAPRNGYFEDIQTTQEKREAIRKGIVPILKQDYQTTTKIQQKLTRYLNHLEQLRQLAGPFPFVPAKILSPSSQRYLRQCQDREWQSILAAVENNQNQNPSKLGFSLPFQGSQPANPASSKAIAELKTYRKQVRSRTFQSSIAKISQARQRYAQAQAKLPETPTIRLSSDKIDTLLELPNQTWQQTKKAILQAAGRILTQGIPPGLPPQMLAAAIRAQLSPSVPKVTAAIAADLLDEVLQGNLTQDTEETKRKAEEAAQAVEPVMLEIKKGKVIVNAGETITQEDFILLDGFGLSRRSVNWFELGLSGVFVTGAVGIFWLVEKRVHRPMRCRDHILLFLLSVSAPLLVIFRFPYAALPAIGLLVSSFYSPALAVTHVSLLTGLVAFASGGIGWEYLLAGAAGGAIAASMAGRLRSREELALLGCTIGLTQGGAYLIVNLILTATVGASWYAVLPGAIICGLSGIAWSVVALGISPFLERLFDVVTPIRLAELSNPNRTLLKQLAIEAPGTFQHTMFVASLVEAAARELHCNVELIRAGTLYHDIGKLHDPLGFIENQMGGPNKHDEINDPWKSAEIIKKHVGEGLAMAHKHGLPQAIQDFIPQHQGRLLISYFYFQAKQRAEKGGGKPVLESDFRYDGPIPQSREAGIMMLADGCEAALRSLKDATPEQALSMVNKIFKARWRDNQLVESGIKCEELPIIAEVFVRVWQQYHHQRIAYPKAALEPQMQGK